MEIFNNTWTYISPIIASFLTYIITIKSKKKDIDIEKSKKLNIVVSNLLDVWSYLDRLNTLSQINKVDLPIPMNMIPVLFSDSKLFNDASFKNLENSISLLKEYDPIVYYELSGIGSRFKEIKSNFILPFLHSKNQSSFNQKLSETYIKETIEEIEEYLISISKHIGYKAIKKIKKKIYIHPKSNIEDIKEDFTLSYYNTIIELIPENVKKPTLEEFKRELNSEETRKQFKEYMSTFSNINFNQLTSIIAEDPYISLEEMKDKLKL
ncbi:hypothetical protein [Tenacibaculum singaporense]|uniref:Uncharacterized protein n=1 Tax=Tenacibaculum singaporense TaxID=2358479 RepID=A0A3S8R947_9FLAO|nr:hypothetical protein [Tenacibaculum singaporense]AZJ36310.1 hypothetical protein D6T69_12525 [Tenacibaculum singaporense]